MWQFLVSGLLLGFFTSSSCPSNALMIRTPPDVPRVRLRWIGLGAVAGYSLLLAVSLAWIVPLANAAPQIIPVFKILGSLVFLYFASTLVFDGVSDSPVSQAAAISSAPGARKMGPFVSGLAATALNPINLAWWWALLTPFLDRSGGIEPWYPIVILLGSLAWFLSFAAILDVARNNWSRRRHRIFHWFGAAILYSYGIRFFIGAIIA